MTALEQNELAVLYVDDEELARKYFVRAMGSELSVQTAANIDEAMDCLRADQHRIGVLVTDYRMPNGTGADLLRQLAQESMQHVVPIIFTAYADKAVLLETLNDGHAFRVLEKPLDIEKMRAVLRAACEQASIRLANQRALLTQKEELACIVHELSMPLANITNSVLSIQYQVANEPSSLGQQASIGMTASAINKNVRYCRSVLSALASARSVSITTAHQLATTLLKSYPLTTEQRAMITLSIWEDFSVYAFPNGIALVLSSILNNSLRAVHGHAAPSICFTVGAGEKPRICISDNGPGIPAEILSQILGNSPVVVKTGNQVQRGGSLMFCNRMMQSIGGSIDISSSPGKTAVTLNFPLLIQENLQ